MNKVKAFFGIVFAAAVLGSAFAMPNANTRCQSDEAPPSCGHK